MPTGQIATPQIFATAKNGYEKRATKAVADLEPDGYGLIYIPIGKAPGRNRRFATRLHHCTVTRLLSWGSGTRCQISLPLRQTSRTR